MATTADTNVFDDNLAEMADNGIILLPVHPRSKKPIGNNWQKTQLRSADDLAELFEGHPGCNVGALLGPGSRLVDIEYDSPEGEKVAKNIGLFECETWSFRSPRGRHWFFRVPADAFPQVNWLKDADLEGTPCEGLEFRIGGDGAAQTLVPPSQNDKGEKREWVDGQSPCEVPLADWLKMPRETRAVLQNYSPGAAKAKGSGRGLDIVKQDEVVEGGRNDTLYRFACWHAGRSPNIASGDEQQMIFSQVMAMNIAKCRPPLPESEVQTLVDSAIFTERKGQGVRGEADSQKDDAPPPSYGAMGLGYDAGRGACTPGDWRLQIVSTEPPNYRLVVPAFKRYTPRGDGAIDIPTDLIDRPGEVARLIRQGTGGRVVVNPFPGEWDAIWRGRKKGKKDPGCEGLFSMLIHGAERVDADIYDENWRVVLEYLLTRLSQAHRFQKIPDSAAAAESFGKPQGAAAGYGIMRGDDTSAYVEVDPDADADGDQKTKMPVWFRWESIWTDAYNAKRFTPEDVQRLRQRIGVTGTGKKPHKYEKRVRWPDGASARYVVFPPEKIKELREMLE